MPDRITLARFVRESPWAQGLAPEDRLEAEQQAVERAYPPGEVVCREGDPPEHWLGVIEGMVTVQRADDRGRSTILGGVPAGGWLGETSILDGASRRFEVVALQASRLCFLPRTLFLGLLQRSLPFNHFVIELLNARLGQFVALTESHRLRDADAQVAHCVAELFNPRLSPHPGEALHGDLPISQQEIGRLAGLSRQVANRALHRLEGAGLLQVHHGGIRVIDLAGLRRFVQTH